MNKKVILLALAAFFCQMVFVPAFAIKAYPFPITVTQPDGTQLTIRLQGNEFHHFQTTEDGFLLKENAKGYLTYATLNSLGETSESEFVAKNADKRNATEVQFLKSINKSVILQSSQIAPQRSKMLSSGNQPRRAYPLLGSPKSLVILVNFTDKSYVTPAPQTAYTNLLNQPNYSTNGGTGSAKDYFMASTYGKFSPNFDVVGPYTLPQNMAFYGGNDASGNDKNPQQMVIDACTLASQNGLDFTQYDTDNDGYVDNIFVYYAGYNEAEGGPANTIWPHRWSLANTSTKFNGKIVYDYSCTSELRGSSGSNMCGIGTFCHEFGHVLGLPDFYHTTATTSVPTLDYWDIMDAGAYNNTGRTPPTYSVYERFFLNYIVPEQKNTPIDLTLLPIYQGTTQPANTINQAFLFSATTHNLNGANPTPKEFFMVEYRKKMGWDTYLPAEGMCVWHIDFDQTAWDNNEPNNYTGTTQTLASHMRVYLVPPTGVGTTPPTTAFTSGSVTPTTWAGTDINRAITAITKTANNITFKLMGGTQWPTISIIGNINAFAMVVGTPANIQTITVSGTNLTGNILLGLLNSTNFDIKLASGSTWSKTLNLVQTAGSVNESVQLRYNPTAVGTQTDQLGMTSAGATSVNINLSGTTTVGSNSPVIFAGKVDNSIPFSATKLNVSNTKTINIKSTDINNNLNLVITGTNASMFTVSTNSVAKDTANGTGGTNITVSYKPTSIGNHTATLTISGGGLNPDKIITLTGTGF